MLAVPLETAMSLACAADMAETLAAPSSIKRNWRGNTIRMSPLH
jgi:hypothetical protein